MQASVLEILQMTQLQSFHKNKFSLKANNALEIQKQISKIISLLIHGCVSFKMSSKFRLVEIPSHPDDLSTVKNHDKKNPHP